MTSNYRWTRSVSDPLTILARVTSAVGESTTLDRVRWTGSTWMCGPTSAQTWFDHIVDAVDHVEAGRAFDRQQVQALIEEHKEAGR